MTQQAFQTFVDGWARVGECPQCGSPIMMPCGGNQEFLPECPKATRTCKCKFRREKKK